VRLHFQEKPWDLYLAVGYTIAMCAALLAFNVGNVFAILCVLFVPGYVLVAALFPGSILARPTEIDWIERIALSFGLSIAVVPLLGLFLNFTPWGIRFAPIVTTISLFTVGVGYAAYWRRMRLPPDRRLSLTANLAISDWTEYSALDKCLAVVLAGSVVAAGGTLAYILLMPRTGETFTEFYILGPSGNASGYPTVLNVSESRTVIVGIGNHEAANANYIVRIDLVGVRLVFNATSGLNETVQVNRTTLSTFNVTLVDGQKWIQPYRLQIDDTGLWKVQFLLFRDGDFLRAYREVHLYVRVA